MPSRREDHQGAEEEKARRRLEELGRRWPVEPRAYLVAIVVLAVFVTIVLLAL